MLALVQLPRVECLEINKVVFGIGWWSSLWWANTLSTWCTHPPSEVSATTLSLHSYVSFNVWLCCIMQVAKVYDTCKIFLWIVMIRGSFGGPFGCNQSKGALTINESSCLRGDWTQVKKKKKLFMFVCLKNKLNSSLSLDSTIKRIRPKINNMFLNIKVDLNLCCVMSLYIYLSKNIII